MLGKVILQRSTVLGKTMSREEVSETQCRYPKTGQGGYRCWSLEGTVQRATWISYDIKQAWHLPAIIRFSQWEIRRYERFRSRQIKEHTDCLQKQTICSNNPQTEGTNPPFCRSSKRDAYKIISDLKKPPEHIWREPECLGNPTPW